MIIISGPGQTCPPPQSLYPSELTMAGGTLQPDAPSNFLTLAAGAAIPIPAQSSQYLYDLGQYCSLEFLDAVTGIWRPLYDMSVRDGIEHIPSDGITRRIANRLGCPVGAYIAGGGSSFAQGTATLTATVGGSTWQPIVGGNLSVSTINNAGAKYNVPPIVLIPAPTPAGVNGSVGGVPATAYATLANNTVSAVSFVNFGAGYLAAPTPVLIPSPYDTNLASITQATVTMVLNAANSGAITAALCTNFGAPLSTLSALTLTAAGGAGSGATITPFILQTVTSTSVVAGGAGWGTATAFARVDSVGGGAGATPAAGFANPAVDMSGFVARGVSATGTTNAGGTITAVSTPNGAGLFVGTPTAAIAAGGTIPTTLASVTFTMGSTYDTIFLQNL